MRARELQAWASAVVAGLLLGMGLGALVGWVIWPLRYYDTEVADLRPDQKATYITLTALVYSIDGDLERARARLHAVQEADIAARVQDMAIEQIRHGDDPQVAYGLALLAQALGSASPTIAEYLAKEPTSRPAGIAPPPSLIAPPADRTPNSVSLPQVGKP